MLTLTALTAGQCCTRNGSRLTVSTVQQTLHGRLSMLTCVVTVYGCRGARCVRIGVESRLTSYMAVRACAVFRIYPHIAKHGLD